MGDSQSADPYSAAIAELEAKISELQSALNTLKSIRTLALGAGAVNNVTGGSGLKGEQNPSDSNTKIAVDAFHTLTVGKAITKYLRMRPKRPATTAEIIEALKSGGQANSDGENFAVVVNNTLNRMQGPDSVISRVKRGLWGLQEWYTGNESAKEE